MMGIVVVVVLRTYLRQDNLLSLLLKTYYYYNNKLNDCILLDHFVSIQESRTNLKSAFAFDKILLTSCLIVCLIFKYSSLFFSNPFTRSSSPTFLDCSSICCP